MGRQELKVTMMFGSGVGIRSCTCDCSYKIMPARQKVRSVVRGVSGVRGCTLWLDATRLKCKAARLLRVVKFRTSGRGNAIK
jgi:hypothetical protein